MNFRRELRKSLVLIIALVWVICGILFRSCGSSPIVSDGDMMKFDQMGFSFTPPNGFVVSQDFGVEVDVPDSDTVGKTNLGPFCIAYTCTEEEYSTLSEKKGWIVLVNGAMANYGLSALMSQETTLEDKPSTIYELNGSFSPVIDPETRTAYGKQVVARIENNRVFSFTCVGPAKRKEETDKLYYNLTGTVRFFAPIKRSPR